MVFIDHFYMNTMMTNVGVVILCSVACYSSWASVMEHNGRCLLVGDTAFFMSIFVLAVGVFGLIGFV